MFFRQFSLTIQVRRTTQILFVSIMRFLFLSGKQTVFKLESFSFMIPLDLRRRKSTQFRFKTNEASGV